MSYQENEKGGREGEKERDGGVNGRGRESEREREEG